jgi:hypothetical protein
MGKSGVGVISRGQREQAATRIPSGEIVSDFYDPSTGEMDFSLALRSLRQHNRITRAQWRGGLYLELDGNTIRIRGNMPSGKIVDEDWQPWSEDLLAFDWKDLI